jgi:hypothetical protein
LKEAFGKFGAIKSLNIVTAKVGGHIWTNIPSTSLDLSSFINCSDLPIELRLPWL